MKYILSLIISGALVVSGFGQTRNVLVGTNNTVVQPTNFWSADASNARSGLGLGSAATNPATAFQPSSSVLSNLASSNAANLTNLRATNIVGVIPSSNIPTVSLTNISGTLAVASGGTGATNAASARTNLGLGWSALTNTNAATTLLGYTANGEFIYTLTNVPTFTNESINLRTVSDGGFVVWDVVNNAFFTDMSLQNSSIVFFGTNADLNKAITRTNLGLGWGALTNTNASTAFLGFITNGHVVYGNTNALTFTNNVSFSGGDLQFITTQIIGNGLSIDFDDGSISVGPITLDTNSSIAFLGSSAAITRTNLGLGWSALTNTSSSTFQTALFGSNTNPVLVNTGGSVISPTNFWQVAPISTTVQNITPTTNSTNSATNSRNLILQSLGTNIVNVTNTILLPTNTSTFNGDSALIIHLGGSGSATGVRQTGAATNLITLTNFDHAVRFIYNNGTWEFYHNIAFVEPIYFSGTNAANNIELSRSNIGLGVSQIVTFGELIVGNQLFVDPEEVAIGAPLAFYGTNAAANAATSRTNLGLGTTNNVSFRNITSDGNIVISNQSTNNNGLLFVYRTNNEPFLGLANLIASNNTTLSNETLFRVGVAEATNRSAQFGFRSTNTNGNGVAVFSVFGYNALAMIGPSTRSMTNSAVEADIYSVNPTNKVMTLITTNTGATLFHRPIEFNNTTNQAATRTNIGLGGGITTNYGIGGGVTLFISNGIITNITP